ncbi:MAG: hypothetical protein HPY66_2241 [Firmicutes bacterium]|nr:hypothetical protein [Bacillota bacterium]
MNKTDSLYNMAKVLRSKNSGPFELTFDVIFDNPAYYELVKRSDVINRETICRLYGLKPEDISHLVFYDPALAVKITIKRPVDSGSVGDTDVYGAQQHAPLMSLQVPLEG